MTDEEAQLAKDKLEIAIREYYEAVDPDVYVHGYVLVTHKESVEVFAEGGSIVGVLVPTSQAWPLTIGMLVAAEDQQRGLGRDR